MIGDELQFVFVIRNDPVSVTKLFIQIINMNSITKLSVVAGVLATVAFAFGVFALFSPTTEKISSFFAPEEALAVASGYGDGGCCGGSTGGSTYTPTANGGGNPFPTSEPKPSCKIKLSKSKIGYNENVVIDWKTSNAKSVKLSGFGDVPKNGGGFGKHTRTAKNIKENTTFTLTVKGDNGKTITCKETVKVEDPVAPTCVAFTSNKNSVPYGGGTVNLTWKTKNVNQASISGVGDVPANGSRNVVVNKDTTFTLTLKHNKLTKTCTTTVKVEDKPVEKPKARCDAFYANKDNVPYGGGDVKLSWNTTNATSVSISGIGNVSADGSKTVFVKNNTTYTLTAKGAGGNGVCSETITVGDKPQEEDFSCDYFEADPDEVDEDEKFTLRWGTTNADSVSINNGIGSVSDDGSIRLSVDSDTTYTLTAKRGSKEVTCKASVDVDHDEHEESPRCDLEISDDDIEEGDRVTLEWDNDNVEDILLEDDDDNVLVDTEDGDNYDPENDEITVKPREDTEYTLTVYGKDGSKRTCEVDVEVDEEEDDDDDVYVSSYRDQQPIVAGIALAQVPYTGFEAGTVLTALFYSLLALWGIAVAYILVVKKGSVFGFALAGAASKVAPAGAVAMAGRPAFAASTASAVPINLPTAPVAFAPVQSEEVTEEVAEEEGAISALEQYAQDSRVLLSTDAIRFIVAQAGTLQAQQSLLDMAIRGAKAKFPTEDGWLVLNKERMLHLFR